MMAVTAQTPLPTPLEVSGLAELTGGRSVYAEESNYEPLFRALAEEVSCVCARLLSLGAEAQRWPVS